MSKTLDQTFSALGHRVRREMIVFLLDGPVRVSEFNKLFKTTQQSISKHIKVLREAGLVHQEQIGRERICKLNSAALKNAARWLDLHRNLWDQRFAQLEKLLDEKEDK